jgi:hypothetical protein
VSGPSRAFTHLVFSTTLIGQLQHSLKKPGIGYLQRCS